MFGPAGMELPFPTVALSKLCSVFVARMMLITHQSYAFNESQIKIMVNCLQIIRIFHWYLLSVFLLNWIMHLQCPMHQADQESMCPLLPALAMSSPLSLGVWSSAQFPRCAGILHLNILCFKQGVFEMNDWIFIKPDKVYIAIMWLLKHHCVKGSAEPVFEPVPWLWPWLSAVSRKFHNHFLSYTLIRKCCGSHTSVNLL